LLVISARNIPENQDEPLGFAPLASVSRVMDDIFTSIPIDISIRGKKSVRTYKKTRYRSVPMKSWGPMLFSYGPFQELINGAKMALKYFVTLPVMAKSGGFSAVIPHI